MKSKLPAMANPNATECPITSQIVKVTSKIAWVSADSIDYRTSCDGKAILASWNDFTVHLLPRNCIALNGTRSTVPDLRVVA
jgi:hypothetical protein